MRPVVFNRADHKPETHCQTVKQPRKCCDPFLSDRELLLFAKGQRFVQGNTQDSVRAFEFASRGPEKLVHFLGEPGKPVLTHSP